MPDQSNYSGVAANIPEAYNNVYRSGSDGNPSNNGFAPGSSFHTGNPTIDMILSATVMVLNHGKPMLHTFGRPDMSAYSFSAMQTRQQESYAYKESIYAMNPMLAKLGPGGHNSLAQMAVDSFLSPGGSMGNEYDTLASFAHRQFRGMRDSMGNVAGPGTTNGAIQANAELSANFVKNVETGFLDENGIFDYSKTHGYNRTEMMQNMRAYEKTFGGFDSVRALTERAVPVGDPAYTAQRSRVDSAQKSFKQMQGVVRAGQDLFGKDMPLDEMMGQIGQLHENEIHTTDSSIRNNLVKIQAAGVVMNRSNQDMLQGLAVAKGTYNSAGIHSGVVDLALSNMITANKIYESKVAATPAGERYTGPGQAEIEKSVMQSTAMTSAGRDSTRVRAVLLSGTEEQQEMVKRALNHGMGAAVEAARSVRGSANVEIANQKILDNNGALSADQDRVLQNQIGRDGMNIINGADAVSNQERTSTELFNEKAGVINNTHFGQLAAHYTNVKEMRKGFAAWASQGRMDDQKAVSEMITKYAKPGTTKDEIQQMTGAWRAQDVNEDYFNALQTKSEAADTKKDKELAAHQQDMNEKAIAGDQYLHDLDIQGDAMHEIYGVQSRMKKAGVAPSGKDGAYSVQNWLDFGTGMVNGRKVTDAKDLTDGERKALQFQADMATRLDGKKDHASAELNEAIKIDKEKKENIEKRVGDFVDRNSKDGKKVSKVEIERHRDEYTKDEEKKAKDKMISAHLKLKDSGKSSSDTSSGDKSKSADGKDIDPDDLVKRITDVLDAIAINTSKDTKTAAGTDVKNAPVPQHK